jgi:hypothetical protein
VTTLLLCDAPLRDLGHMAIVQHTQRTLPDAGRIAVVRLDPDASPAELARIVANIPPPVEQVVLSGAFLSRHALEQSLAFAAAGVAAGARFVVHNLSLEGKAGATLRPNGADVLDLATALEVRDHRTATQLTHWGLAQQPRILAYPERHIAPDEALLAGLPPGPLLGVALRGGDEMEAFWRPRINAIAAALGPAADWPILPLHTCPPGLGEDDFGGTRILAGALRPGAPLLLSELGDRKTWSRSISPARLKALVGRCALVMTNRELPAAYAMASGVPVLGLAVGMDRRILTCFATLANELPRGSRMLRVSLSPGA